MRVHPRPAPSGAGISSPIRPDRSGRSLPRHVLTAVAADLEVAAAARQAQLNALPPATTLVAAAHRRSVRRILDAIRAAQAQLADGTYGACLRCDGRADVAAALARPWEPLCRSCARR